jgi:hypothetical protein
MDTALIAYPLLRYKDDNTTFYLQSEYQGLIGVCDPITGQQYSVEADEELVTSAVNDLTAGNYSINVEEWHGDQKDVEFVVNQMQ